MLLLQILARRSQLVEISPLQIRPHRSHGQIHTLARKREQLVNIRLPASVGHVIPSFVRIFGHHPLTPVGHANHSFVLKQIMS